MSELVAAAIGFSVGALSVWCGVKAQAQRDAVAIAAYSRTCGSLLEVLRSATWYAVTTTAVGPPETPGERTH